MTNQTAVDFLASELAGHLGPANGPELLEILERAKAMEKHQIKEAFKNGRMPEMFRAFTSDDYYKSAYLAEPGVDD